jgi:predicted nucleic acid-binding protein
VILVDANVLIYAHVNSFAQHRGARDWLDQQLNGWVLSVCRGSACLLSCGW